MLVLEGGGSAGSCTASGRSSVNPSILDSPTLARVERAMLRHDEGVRRDGAALQRAAFTQSLLPSNYGKDAYNALKKGLLWQQRDKLFSRWKERYFILTRDYLHCFRRASGNDRISEMGQFLFKVKLVDVDRVEWENKKTYSTVALVLMGRDGKIYLRATDGLEDWFEMLEECTYNCKERKRAFRSSCDEKRDNNNIRCLDDWLADRQKISLRRLPTDTVSTQQEVVKKREWMDRRGDEWDSTLNNRLSLLTDIDINAYDDDTIGTTSVTSYRMNEDVLCIQPPSLRNNSAYKGCQYGRPTTTQDIPPHMIRFRERSYSNIEKCNWRAPSSFK
ncbi:PREDICTED: uncharacterized protein LOC108563872 [Nicrophorus vespilloides]|uniref:Uncharacterized protein LOC108563872 n=1 Tax=Nicrophorus vespilloides TaxID=110193 RepID=A0ABM1MUB4_NICVS|nr:PREDICTED: uncharacterized protein LOC108563872 [Nicrophorus vespilloides]